MTHPFGLVHPTPPLIHQCKLGKLPHRHDPRTLHASAYLAPGLIVPNSHNWAEAVKAFSMFGNDKVGDCAFATVGNTVKLWTANAGQEIDLTDQDIVGAYSSVTGYTPSDPSTDRGTVWLDLMKVWRADGVAGHSIDAFALAAHQEPWMFRRPVNNPALINRIKQVIFLFGAAPLGVQLPLSWQGAYQWTVSNLNGANQPGSWGGHAIPAVAYNAQGVMVVSWGRLYFMSWTALCSYLDEAWLAVSCDWVDANGLAPNHFNLDQLTADVQLLQAA